MAILTDIIVHHFGGVGNDAHASTQHFTVEDIARAHKERWNFPSQYIKGELGYVGYHFVIEDNGIITQCRALGEESAHCKGHNFTSVGIALAGNFNVGTDTPTEAQIKSLKRLLITLVEGKRSIIEQYIVAPNTVFNFSGSHIFPHREFSQTDCYGWILTHYWARNLYIGYLSEKLRLLQDLIKLFFALKNTVRGIKPMPGRAGDDDRECSGSL